ncbi:FG-GAP-like repeat-containing protein [Halobacteriovorax sp. RZ-2]|uniref:FG-GAP-like repeat-containing protein n=1 Tax=unclassified Halobacteriovorax TaxID=2639665 RepID=UPI003722FD1F
MRNQIILFGLLIFNTNLLALEDYSTGIVPEALSLPSGPGTISGFTGEVVDSSNTGNFNYQYSLSLPKGVNDHAPKIRIIYNSSNGISEFGLGWNLNLKNISRNLRNGVPSFQEGDSFYSSEGDLIKVNFDGNSDNWYAPKINQNGNRYHHENNIWNIYYSDLSEDVFGVNSTSRHSSSSGTTKWLISEEKDRSGNLITYHYSGENYKYLDEIRYGYNGATYKYQITFEYQESDSFKSSYRSGVYEQLDKLCSDIYVKSNSGRIIKHYILEYSDSNNAKIPYLERITVKGVDDSVGEDINPPVEFSYGNSIAPEVQSFSFNDSIIPNFKSSNTLTIDLNRDGLVDYIETSRNGLKVWTNNYGNGFEGHYVDSSFINILDSKQTKLMDIDGDRVVDFVVSGLAPKVFKGGVDKNGSFSFSNEFSKLSLLPHYNYSSSEVRTIDLNGDGHLDFLIRLPEKLISILSDGESSYKKIIYPSLSSKALSLASKSTLISDFNGDGLVDLGKIDSTGVYYFPSLGNGDFGQVQSIRFDESNKEIWQISKNSALNKFIADFNGDGIVDYLVANKAGVAIVYGRSNGSFSPIFKYFDKLINYSDKDIHIDIFDINGDGVSDVVWTNYERDFRYLSFYKTGDNLLRLIDNNQGKQVEIQYTPSTAFEVVNKENSTGVSFAAVTKIKTTIFGYPSRLIEKDIQYKSPYYNGISNEFRGFNEIVEINLGDNSRPTYVQKKIYNQGDLDYYLKGLLTEKSIFTFDTENILGDLLKSEHHTYNSFLLDESFSNESKRANLTETLKVEGDEYGNNTRSNKTTYSYTFQNGFLTESVKSEYSSSDSIYRKLTQQYALDQSGLFSLNKVCEESLYDSNDTLVASQRVLYDDLSLCYTSDGNVSSIERYDGSSYVEKTHYTYYNSGNIKESYDGRNNKTSYFYDANFINLTSIQNPLGHLVSANYDIDTGTMISFTDENLRVHALEYDSYLRPVKMIGPADSSLLPTISYEYSFGSNTTLSTIITKARQVSGEADTFDEKVFLDTQGKEIFKISEGVSSSTYTQVRKEFNIDGQEYKIYNPIFVNGFNQNITNSNGQTVVQYDPLMREEFRFNPQHTTLDPSFIENKYEVGKKTIYDENRHKLITFIDEFSRVSEVENDQGHKNSYLHDIMDNVTSIVDPHLSSTNFYFDFQNRRACKEDPTVGVVKYAHNNDNLIISRKEYDYFTGATCSNLIGSFREIQYDYDKLGRKELVDYGTGSTASNIVLNYDEVSSSYGIGKLTSVNYGQGSKSYNYNIYDSLASETQTTSSGSYTTTFDHEVNGRLNSIVYPQINSNSLEVFYNYANNNHVVGVDYVKNGSAQSSLVSNVSYNEFNMPTLVDRSNGISDEYVYNSADKSYRLLSLIIANNTNDLLNYTYSYDSSSKIIGIDETVYSESEQFFYDSLNRLEEYFLNSVKKRDLTYDEIGNILQKEVDGVVKSYSYEQARPQVLTNYDSASYTFDGFGNLSNIGTKTFNFDESNRLNSFSDGTTTSNYIYDHENMRVEKSVGTNKTEYIGKYTEVNSGNPVYHVFLGEQRIASFDSSGTFSHIHQNHQQSTVLRTDSTGNVVFNQKYFPFGESRSGTALGGDLNSLYTDQYYDNESDVYYYKNRYYLQNVGRFASADMLYLEEMNERGMRPLEMNVYSYVGNDPVNNVDPNGLAGLSLGGSGSGGLIRMAGKEYGVVGTVDFNPISKNFLRTEVGTFETKTSSFGVGGGASVSMKVTATIGNDNIKELNGISGGASVSGPFLKADGGVSLGGSGEGTPVASVSLGVGTPTEVFAGGHVSETKTHDNNTKVLYDGLWNNLMEFFQQ